jgi:hypothetical protein
VSPITLALSGLMVVLGIAMVVRTIAAGGGAAATGIILGVLFVAAARPSSRATASTSCGASSPAGRSCSTT